MGDILMARKVELGEMVHYVASDVGRRGAWNYKNAIGAGMAAGTDLAKQAREAIRQLRLPLTRWEISLVNGRAS